MKNGSTTTKNVGDMVAVGEYLGIVGSSGISTIPHLHFEVLTDETFSVVVDPYLGSCNSTTTDSWWESQNSYSNPGINAVLTHSAAPVVFPTCPTPETPNIKNDFETDDTIYFAVYVRDQTANDNVSLEIIRPDNSSLFGNWSLTVQTTSPNWYYLWNYNGYFDMVGQWKWRVTFGGETVTHTFNVSSALSTSENLLKNTNIYPNPTHDVIHISTIKKIVSAEIVNITGKTINTFNNTTEGIKTINISNLANGMYFLRLSGEENASKTIKLIKN
jgi:hypothetical protein